MSSVNRLPAARWWSSCPQLMRGAISGTQKHSEAISVLTFHANQWQSVAISVLTFHANQWPSVAISGHQWPSVAISGLTFHACACER